MSVDLAAIRLGLQRRASRKEMRALRIDTLDHCGYSNEQIRRRLDITVDKFRRADGWLKQAAMEGSMSPGGVLPIHVALAEYRERHVDGVLKVGLLHEGGYTRLEIQERLGITRSQFEVALMWWRDAMVDSGEM